MILILLDRNAVSEIKYKLDGGKLLTDRSRKLRLLDKKKHIISPILSIREGQSGAVEDETHIQKTLS